MKKSNKNETEKTFQLYKLIEIKKTIIKKIWTKFEETPSWRASLKNQRVLCRNWGGERKKKLSATNRRFIVYTHHLWRGCWAHSNSILEFGVRSKSNAIHVVRNLMTHSCADTCIACIINFFLMIFKFVKLSNRPLAYVIITKKNHDKKTKKILIISLGFFVIMIN